MSTLLDKAVSNSTWTGIGSAGSALLNLLFAGLMVRWLGVADAGFVLAVTSLAAFNSSLSGIGLAPASIRYLSEARGTAEPNTERRIIRTCISVALLFGILAMLLLSCAGPMIIRWARYPGNTGTAIAYCQLIGITFLCRQLSDSMASFLEGYQRFRLLTTRNLLLGLTNGLLGIVFLRAFPTILTAGILSAVLAVVDLTVLWRMVSIESSIYPLPGWCGQTFAKLWRFGRWSYLTTFVVLLFYQLDRLVMTSLFGGAQLPLYSLAKRSYEIGHEAFIGQAAYLFPMLSSQGDKREEVVKRIEPKMRWFMSIISIWFYSSTVLLVPALLDIIIGGNFGSNISLYVLIFSVVGIFHAQSIVPWYILYATDRVGLASTFAMLCTICVLPLMVLLGRQFGLTAAVCGQFGIILAVLIFHILWWKDMCLKEKAYRLFQPMAISLVLFGSACVLWAIGKHLDTALRLVIGGIFAVLFLPLAVRLEKLFFPVSEAPATLLRAMQKVGERAPLTTPLIGLIFGQTTRAL